MLFENIKLPTLVVLKTDYESNNGIPNTTYEIKWEDLNGGIKTIGTYKTNADGRIVLPFVQSGWYQIIETIPAQGYQLPTNPVNRIYLADGDNSYTTTEQGNIGGNDVPSGVNVKSGKDYPVVAGIVNYPLNSIIVKKSDANTGEMLSGATFEIIKVTGQTSGQNGTVMFTVTTDNSGVVVITGLPAGAYAIREIKPPTNYIISETNMQNVNLKADGTSVVEVLFRNHPYGGIFISKVDAVTGKPLANAKFKVTNSSGAVVGNTNGEFITNENGEILIENVKPAAYVITEILPPQYYIADTTPQTVNVGTDGKVYKVSFKNQPSGTLVIRKLDTKTKQPLGNTEFIVTTSSGNVVGNSNGIFVTDASGTITIPHLPKDSYIIEETKAATGYILENQTKTIEIDYGKTYTVDFYNKKMSGLQIIKVDSQTKKPLKHVEFAIYKQSGEMIGRYETDADGVIIIETLEPGWYKIVETKTVDGYILDDKPKDVEITDNQFLKVVFENNPMSGLLVRKVDDKTLIPLAGMEFTIKKMNGELVGNYRTGADGTAYIPNLPPAWYTITETAAPDGYSLGYGDNTQKVEITHSKLITIEFRNKAFGSIIIKKIDEITGEPLTGAYFTVKHQNGTLVGEYTTGKDGTISISNVDSGWYVISETKPPTGYTLDSTAKSMEVKPSVPTVTTFTNKPHSGIAITKIDAFTKVPLMGATFVVERTNGEKIGTYKTDVSGKIIVPNLTEGSYIVSETIPPTGYILEEKPKTVVVVSGKLTEVEFTNKPFAGLKIIKLSSDTRQPIEGVEFVISKMSGEKVENDFRGFTFKTDKSGQIYIPNLTNGYYTVTETRSADGYILDSEPKTILVETGKPTVLEVLNTPMSGLLIVKTDDNTGKPLKGVVFDVRRADGSFVSGNILDGNQPNTPINSPNKTTSANGDVTGSYTTDSNGRILINGLAAGQYNVVERKALDGYELDTEVHNVTITPGKLITLQLTNKPKAGLRLLKIDSITKKPIFNVEFMLFDSNNKVVGTYYTNDKGIIDFTGDLTEGRYTIRETRAANGYYLDEIPKTVEFVSGKITEIVWTNTPQMGQVQLIKKSGDDSEITGLPAGTPLSGAVFEIYAYKSGNLIDRFVSGNDGKAVSSPLPLGRYIIREVQPPKNYKLSTKELDIEIEFATQIIKQEFLNYSANTGVYIKKTGNLEAMPGDIIRYDIKAVQNTSTVPLTDFFWRDVLPTDAVRLSKIVTGTYNQSLKYKIIANTNKGNSFIIADNLSTTRNNVIDCSNASLGLRSDEYVTKFTVIFGNVKAGFSQVEQPQVYVKVLKSLPNGYEFANKADVGGKYGGEWIIANSTWLTKIYAKPGKLPRTGY